MAAFTARELAVHCVASVPAVEMDGSAGYSGPVLDGGK
jgi:hypothetical protein